MANAGGVATGAETIAELRKCQVGSLIVGLSSNDLQEAHLSAGANLFWRKPIPAPANLAQTLRELLPLPSRWRVLAADDSAVVRRMLVRKLQMALPGCIIVEACSALEASTALFGDAHSHDASTFDLVVLDEDFGEGSTKGTDLAIAARAAGLNAVIAGLSGSSMEAAHLDAGCDLSWPKSIDVETMRADLLQCIRAGIPAGTRNEPEMRRLFLAQAVEERPAANGPAKHTPVECLMECSAKHIDGSATPLERALAAERRAAAAELRAAVAEAALASK